MNVTNTVWDKDVYGVLLYLLKKKKEEEVGETNWSNRTVARRKQCSWDASYVPFLELSAGHTGEFTLQMFIELFVVLGWKFGKFFELGLILAISSEIHQNSLSLCTFSSMDLIELKPIANFLFFSVTAALLLLKIFLLTSEL